MTGAVLLKTSSGANRLTFERDWGEDGEKFE